MMLYIDDVICMDGDIYIYIYRRCYIYIDDAIYTDDDIYI